MARWVVARAEEVPPGEHKRVEAGGRPIALFNLGGEFFAMIDKCPHQGGSLCAGTISGHVRSPEPGVYLYERRGEMVRCPWHYWEFDIRTGQSWFDPAKTKVRQYPAHVESGAQLQQGPYKAETLPVTVEDNYIVIEA